MTDAAASAHAHAPDPLALACEERLFNAWPALQTVHRDGWLWRMAAGHTKRANAASPWRGASLPDAAFLADLKWLYRRAGVRPMIRITPLAPAGSDAVFAAAGWTLFDETTVMVADLAQKVAQKGAPEAAVILAEAPSPAWVEGAAQAYEFEEWQAEALAAIVSNIRVEAAFATVYLGRAAVGYGLGVVERGYVGLYDLAVAPAARGLGVGTRLVAGLMHWGRSKGAGSAYLQVRDANVRARALYGRLGFADAYRYWCRVPPT